MNLVFDFSENDFINLCAKNSQRKDTTIARDIYDAITYFMQTSIDKKLNVTEIKFSSVHSDDHLSLVDYFNRGFIEFSYPTIDIYSEKENSIGVEKVTFPDFAQLVGINYGHGIVKKIIAKKHSLKTKNRLTVRLLNLRFGKQVLNKIMMKTEGSHTKLLSSQLGTWVWPQTFYNKVNGEVYFCKCFEKAIKISAFSLRRPYHIHIQKAFNNQSYKESICHMCLNTNSDLFYCIPMYGSAFKVRYGAYIKKTAIENGIDERDAENIIREKKGVAKIGEKWISETLLFNYIEVLFSPHTIKREASPPWLGKQRLDVYIESLMLGIEYQGEQHFKAIDLFGGQDGLKRTKERDREKLERCKANKINLVYFTYKDDLSEELITSRLKRYLDKESSPLSNGLKEE